MKNIVGLITGGRWHKEAYHFLKNLKKNHPSLHVFTGQIDAKLDKNKFIVPGLGDAGDRYMGT